jgi:hypothetical protein
MEGFVVRSFLKRNFFMRSFLKSASTAHDRTRPDYKEPICIAYAGHSAQRHIEESFPGRSVDPANTPRLG